MQMAVAFRTQLALWQTIGLCVFVGEMGGQQVDILWSFAQWRDLQIDHIEAEQKVFAEIARAHFIGKIAVRGGQNANVNRHWLGAADAIDDAFLNGAQQFGLQANVHF